MVNFGLLAAEIDPVVWGTPANFFIVYSPFVADFCLLSRQTRTSYLL